MNTFPKKIGGLVEQYKLREALTELMNLARLGNKYLADTEPWKLKKTDEKRTETILNIALQIANHLMVLSEPFLPFTSIRLQEILNVQKSCWDEIKSIDVAHHIGKASLLFSKIEDEQIEQQIAKLGNE
jgi:methionyl-tRNA synthetase